MTLHQTKGAELIRFRERSRQYMALPQETANRVSFERYCEIQDELDEAKQRAREYMRAAAAADTHSSDVEPGRVDPWEER